MKQAPDLNIHETFEHLVEQHCDQLRELDHLKNNIIKNTRILNRGINEETDYMILDKYESRLNKKLTKGISSLVKTHVNNCNKLTNIHKKCNDICHEKLRMKLKKKQFLSKNKSINQTDRLYTKSDVQPKKLKKKDTQSNDDILKFGCFDTSFLDSTKEKSINKTLNFEDLNNKKGSKKSYNVCLPKKLRNKNNSSMLEMDIISEDKLLNQSHLKIPRTYYQVSEMTKKKIPIIYVSKLNSDHYKDIPVQRSNINNIKEICVNQNPKIKVQRTKKQINYIRSNNNNHANRLSSISGESSSNSINIDRLSMSSNDVNVTSTQSSAISTKEHIDDYLAYENKPEYIQCDSKIPTVSQFKNTKCNKVEKSVNDHQSQLKEICDYNGYGNCRKTEIQLISPNGITREIFDNKYPMILDNLHKATRNNKNKELASKTGDKIYYKSKRSKYANDNIQHSTTNAIKHIEYDIAKDSNLLGNKNKQNHVPFITNKKKRIYSHPYIDLKMTNLKDSDTSETDYEFAGYIRLPGGK